MKTNNLVILCGGKGTRIKKITRYIPKPMIKFNGIYFLQYLINFYSKYNFKKIYLLAGYKGDLIKKNFHKKRFNLVETECIIEKKPLGTAGCLNLLPKNIDSFFLINGDSYFDYNFEEFYKFCKNKDAAMLLVENKNYKSNKKLSSIKINKTKHIIYSKTNKIMNAGVYFFKKKIFQNKLTNISLENEIIPKLISNNKIYGIKLKGLFIDIGLYKNLKIANKILKKLIKPAIFLDRDGVIFKDLGYVNSLKRVIWTKSLFTTLKKLQKYLIFIVTNQAGIGRGLYTKKEFYIFQKKLKKFLLKKKFTLMMWSIAHITQRMEKENIKNNVHLESQAIK